MIAFFLSSLLISLLAKYLLDLNGKNLALTALFKRERVENGQQLYRELLGLNRFYLANGKKLELTEYKFFTEILDELLIFYRKGGANILEHIKEIRKNLILDLKQEKKLAAFARASRVEMALISGLSLCFALFANLFAQVSIEASALTLVFAWQLLGVCVFVLFQKHGRSRMFKPFFAYLKRASLLDVLIKTNQPVNLIAKKMNLATLPPDPVMFHLKERIEVILSQIQSAGVYDEEQSRELGQECWFCYEQKLELYQQTMKRLKLLVISLFFLGGYLYLFYALILSLRL
ncbi:MAG: hypothetical protein WD025_02315 [Bacteriovoracaceae bacterium]